MKEVETNIGRMPIEDYRDIAASQWGFDDYADMRAKGYLLGNGYDTKERGGTQLDRDYVQSLKERFPQGTRVVLDEMGDDPNPLPPNSRGTVTAVDDAGTVHIAWDNGRQLGLIPGEDFFHKIPECQREDGAR